MIDERVWLQVVDVCGGLAFYVDRPEWGKVITADGVMWPGHVPARPTELIVCGTCGRAFDLTKVSDYWWLPGNWTWI